MRIRPHLGTSAWLAVTAFALFAFYGGYALRGLLAGMRHRAVPFVHADVSSDELSRLGFPFGRPPTVTRVVFAIVGNGVGDSAAYASFDLPVPAAREFMDTLKSKFGFQSYTHPIQVHYLEQLPPEVSATLWPRTGFDNAEVLLGSDVLVAYLAGTGRIHAFKP